ncbi:LOW QUALITY PROTEIN: E3 ubiquitin-protein ligase SIAH2-like [Dromiciops gliroides]|uniref:LOW QUALITY PROTEIN: E3 ubiquitin-protein ligase SIAH2-like n=1 Tax=Dromiciops gliroides TaxID=33562 RepID=UPI001CC6973E|nr:LOW QUALITY PROTEIN: E3 ubiquitin-protein ligase SIAH2-like [Dromiciops gliroides]
MLKGKSLGPCKWEEIAFIIHWCSLLSPLSLGLCRKSPPNISGAKIWEGNSHQTDSTLPHMKKPEHEDMCEDHPYSCPCPGASCKWQGSLEAVMSHLTHAHKSITTLQGEEVMFLATDINFPGTFKWVMMQFCFGHHFMLELEKQEMYKDHQQFVAMVLIIGTQKQAENFAYKLELNCNQQRLTWETKHLSIHDEVATTILKCDCLVFDTATAHLFADNRNLRINVKISTCCP